LIGLAVFGGPLFDADESNAIQISEVSIISTEAFEGMMSSAPNPEVENPEQSDLAQPDPVEDVPVVTEPVEQPVEEPAEPEVQEVTEPEPTPELDTEPAEPEVVEAPEAVQIQEATGNEVVAPDAQISEQDQSGQVDPNQLALLRPKPRPAPRISNEVVEKPPTDAEQSEETAEQTVPSDELVEEVKPEETVEAAKPESTTEIVTEADEVDPNSAAPIKSSRPKGRPSDIVQKAQARKAAAEQAKADKIAADKAAEEAAENADKIAEAEAQKKAEAEAIEAAIKAANAEASKPSGPPLTGREKGALVLAVQRCWNPPIGVQNAGDLKVTLLVELNEQGKISGGPTLVSPSGSPQGVVKQAYEAGRRALLRCGPYELPKDKYEQWRQIEVTFNPQNMVVK
jgi:hypothetical protein